MIADLYTKPRIRNSNFSEISFSTAMDLPYNTGVYWETAGQWNYIRRTVHGKHMYTESRIARKDYLWIACSRVSSKNKVSKRSMLDAIILLLSINLGCLMETILLLIK
jgi:hypothetical protein